MLKGGRGFEWVGVRGGRRRLYERMVWCRVCVCVVVQMDV